MVDLFTHWLTCVYIEFQCRLRHELPTLASPNKPPNRLAVPQEDQQLQAEVEAGLAARGASPEIVQFVAQTMQRQRAVYMERLQGLENQRQTLVHIASSLVVRGCVSTVHARRAPPHCVLLPHGTRS